MALLRSRGPVSPTTTTTAARGPAPRPVRGADNTAVTTHRHGRRRSRARTASVQGSTGFVASSVACVFLLSFKPFFRRRRWCYRRINISHVHPNERSVVSRVRRCAGVRRSAVDYYFFFSVHVCAIRCLHDEWLQVNVTAARYIITTYSTEAARRSSGSANERGTTTTTKCSFIFFYIIICNNKLFSSLSLLYMLYFI